MRPGARRFGPPPLPRVGVNQPALYEAVRASGYRQSDLALVIGMTPGNAVSVLVRAEFVPAGTVHVTRLEKLADFIGFPREQLFVERGAR
jgi:hypothetical protein